MNRSQKVELTQATEADAPGIAALCDAAAERLTATFGRGPWSSVTSARSMFLNLGRSRIYILRQGSRLLATLKLGTKKPWAIDTRYFSPCPQPLYLTSMVVHPAEQNLGHGRHFLEEARRIAREWPAQAIRLDAYDAAAGAGEFYRKCGFREVGRKTYRNTPLIYFEWLAS